MIWHLNELELLVAFRENAFRENAFRENAFRENAFRENAPSSAAAVGTAGGQA